MYNTYLYLSIFVPLIGSVLILLFKENVKKAWAVLLSIASFVFACLLIPPILKGEVIKASVSFLGSELSNLSFIGDGISLIFALTSSLLGVIAVIYSLSYIKECPNQTEYYFMTILMIGSLMGLAFSGNLILFYIFWEIASITTWRLVGFFRKKEVVLFANKTLLMIFGGSSLMLLGFALIYANTQTFDLIALKNHSVSNLVLSLIFVGVLAKAAVLPIHTWLPDAHTVAPSPVSSLLSGIVAQIGLFAFIRIFCWTFNITWTWILILAVTSSIVAGTAALVEKDMKKIIAYSTVSQVGFILLGFALLSDIGIAAGLLYFVVHAVGKAGLFLSAGIVEQKCGTRDITKLGGLMSTMPITGIAFVFCALSIIGIPPFGGFYSKLMLIIAIIRGTHYWIAALAILGTILTLLYLFRLFDAVFLGERKIVKMKEGTRTMVACTLALGIISLAIGLFISQTLGLTSVAVASVLK